MADQGGGESKVPNSYELNGIFFPSDSLYFFKVFPGVFWPPGAVVAEKLKIISKDEDEPSLLFELEGQQQQHTYKLYVVNNMFRIRDNNHAPHLGGSPVWRIYEKIRDQHVCNTIWSSDASHRRDNRGPSQKVEANDSDSDMSLGEDGGEKQPPLSLLRF